MSLSVLGTVPWFRDDLSQHFLHFIKAALSNELVVNCDDATPGETCGVISLLIAIRVKAEDSFVLHAHQHCRHCRALWNCRKGGRKNIYQLQLKSFSSPEVGKAFHCRFHLIQLLHIYLSILANVSLLKLDGSTRFHVSISRDNIFLFVRNVTFLFSQVLMDSFTWRYTYFTRLNFYSMLFSRFCRNSRRSLQNLSSLQNK